jgi:hypothetical protein
VKQRITTLIALVAVLSVGAISCDQTTTPDVTDGPTGPTPPEGPATLKVLLTDAAADYVAGAWVDIGAVHLLPVDESASPITLTEDGTDGMINLLDFQDGATTELAEATFDPGEYKQLRLVVEEASVDLIDGYTFRDGSTSQSLKVPSGAQSGIKLHLWPAEGTDNDDGDAGVMIVPGETVIVLDFDVNQSFLIQGNPETPAGIKSMHFQPTIRVTARDVAGSISGTVSGAADSIEVEGLEVTAEPTGPATVPGYQTLTGTALTDGEGTYTIYFLVPGEYEVGVAVAEGFYTEPLSATVDVGEAEDVAGIDFLIDETGSISGTVTGAADSINVEGLTVTAEDGDGGTHTAETDAEGAYTIGGLIPGEYAVWVDVPEGFVTTPATADVTVGGSEDVTGVDFEIDEAGSISGAVTAAADSIAVDGLTVTAENTSSAASFTAETDSEGAYVIENVWPGDYEVTVGVDEGFITSPESAAVSVGVAEDVPDIDFEIDEGG